MMDEAPFSYTQKLNGMNLLTVRGSTMDEFLNNAAALSLQIGSLLETTRLIDAASITEGGLHGSTPLPEAPSAPQWGGTPPAAPPAPPAAPAAFTQAATAIPACIHGQRTPRSGTGAKGPWKAFFCPSPKGTPNQCEAIWVRQGTPEWSVFPA